MLKETKFEVIQSICRYLEGKQSTNLFKWQKNNQNSGDRI